MRRLARFIKFYGGTIIILFASFCMYEVCLLYTSGVSFAFY